MEKANNKKHALSSKSSVDPEVACRSIIPQQHWNDVMESLGRSIMLAHKHGPDRWGLRLATDSIMLKVGPHEVLQIGDWDLPFHLIVDSKTVPSKLRTHPELRFSEGDDYYGNTKEKGYYPSSPGSEACDMPFNLVRYTYQELLYSHSEIIASAAKKPMHSSTRFTHSVELIRYVAGEIGKELSQPIYSEELAENYLPLIAEELPGDEQFTEGAAQQILVNAYERDRRARQLCIEHYGSHCCACGMSFEEQYGAEAAGIIHVHHIIALSEIKESYQVDPIRDLRPICPNCHAVIHATRSARSIEQVIKMIRGERKSE